ncbi:hypothetical protein LG198_02285 [Methylobacillus arboreus]|uniref:hypothetical protein n=1 Tax=Methylobacillus arboreus TaxID=755170 RepID=UPI001E298329|nr:hypothetical protein [Methylobacillus arboreus]MCB5189559.1 hypothetical protein [Methylobacillus arboreus]
MAENKTGSWWQTIPGILTAIAGIITALTGLVVTIQQTGWFGTTETGKPNVSSNQDHPIVSQQAPPETSITPIAAREIKLPDGNNVRMDSGTGNEFRYTILSATSTPEPPNQQRISLKIRAWTNAAGGLNFWSDSFRLQAGEIRIKPSNYLNELVARDETKDSLVEFLIDRDMPEATLSITVGGLNFSGNQRELKLLLE